jgi:hypothetical protein
VESVPVDVAHALFELSRVYASAADQRDRDRFLGVFAPDARLTVCRPGPDAVPRTITGHDELASIPTSLARFERTFHLLGQAGYEGEGDRATGEVYCVAHHLTRDAAGTTDTVMFIRYADEYRADASGAWRIADRRVQIDWTETRPA